MKIISVRVSARKALRQVSAQRETSMPAFKALKNDVRELKSLETRVSGLDRKFSRGIGAVHREINSSNRKTHEAISRLATRTANAVATSNEHFNDKLSERGASLGSRIDEVHSQLVITRGNHERRLNAIEDAVMKMHEAVEALNDNWKEFTESLLVSER